MALKLGEALVKASIITKEQLRLGLERQVVFGGRLGTNLIELGIIGEVDLTAFLSKHLKVPSVNSEELMSSDEETIACITAENANKYKIVPFRKVKKRLYVAMLDPQSVVQIDELKFMTGYDIRPYVVSELSLYYAMEKYYGIKRDLRYISIYNREKNKETDADQEEVTEKELITKIKEEFANAKNKEEVIGILLSEAKNIASRVGVFILKENSFSGWQAKGFALDNIKVVTDSPSIFSDVLNRKSYYRGPLLKIPGNESLIKALSGNPQDCVLIPVHIREKIIALLYADNGNASVMDASLGYIHSLVTMASISFEIIILRNKILTL